MQNVTVSQFIYLKMFHNDHWIREQEDFDMHTLYNQSKLEKWDNIHLVLAFLTQRGKAQN